MATSGACARPFRRRHCCYCRPLRTDPARSEVTPRPALHYDPGPARAPPGGRPPPTAATSLA